jgi:hypothetical protein
MARRPPHVTTCCECGLSGYRCGLLVVVRCEVAMGVVVRAVRQETALSGTGRRGEGVVGESRRRVVSVVVGVVLQRGVSVG